METLLGALLIFLLRICDVSIGTLRMMLTIHGKRLIAAGLGFVEVTIFIVAIGKAVSQLDNVLNLLAYSGGFAVGTLVGAIVEDKLAIGLRIIRVITHRRNEKLVKTLREAKFAVTVLTGQGKDGEVFLLFSVVKRKRTKEYVDIVTQMAPKAVVTVEEAKQLVRGYLSGRYGKAK